MHPLSAKLEIHLVDHGSQVSSAPTGTSSSTKKGDGGGASGGGLPSGVPANTSGVPRGDAHKGKNNKSDGDDVEPSTVGGDSPAAKAAQLAKKLSKIPGMKRLGGIAGFGARAGAQAQSAGLSAGAVRGAIVAGAVVAGFAAAVAVSVKAVQLFTRTMNEQVEILKDLSPDIAAAVAGNQVNQQMLMLDRAERIGPQLSEFVNVQGAFADIQSRIWTRILEVLLQIFEFFKPAVETAVGLGLKIAEAAEWFGGLAIETIKYAGKILENWAIAPGSMIGDWLEDIGVLPALRDLREAGKAFLADRKDAAFDAEKWLDVPLPPLLAMAGRGGGAPMVPPKEKRKKADLGSILEARRSWERARRGTPGFSGVAVEP